MHARLLGVDGLIAGLRLQGVDDGEVFNAERAPLLEYRLIIVRLDRAGVVFVFRFAGVFTQPAPDAQSQVDQHRLRIVALGRIDAAGRGRLTRPHQPTAGQSAAETF